MAEVIKEIDWNGNHYKFTNTFRSTGSRNHDILEMTDSNGNTFKGEEVWSNRPWHRFSLENAFTEIVEKAFGPKAKELILKINEESGSVESAIEKFFSEFKPEDITSSEDDSFDTSDKARITALATYLEISPKSIKSLGDNKFECEEGEYLVLTDEEADNEFDEIVRNTFENEGLEFYTDEMKERIMSYACDEDELEDFVRRDQETLFDEMSDDDVVAEYIRQDLGTEEDMYEDEFETIRDDVDVDKLRAELVDNSVDSIEDYYQYLTDVLGYPTDSFSTMIDTDKAVEVIKDEIIENGSRGQELAYYDGDEIEQDNFYIYRID